MEPAPGCGQEMGLGLWEGGRATSSKLPAWEPEPRPAGEPEAQTGTAGVSHLSVQRAGRHPTSARPGLGPLGHFFPSTPVTRKGKQGHGVQSSDNEGPERLNQGAKQR